MFYIISRFYRCAAGCGCQRWHAVSVLVFESVGRLFECLYIYPRFALSLGLYITHGSAYSQFSPCLFSRKSEALCRRVLLAGNLEVSAQKSLIHQSNKLYVSGTEPPSITIDIFRFISMFKLLFLFKASQYMVWSIDLA
jgi:hypothetical protein